ncbi:MAG TPA: response regulator transcription factor [Myxococcales bacterium]|nr:response regulator transcription factor [Myxococcales bacterium]
MSRLRVLLADDHTLVRAGLRSLLETMPGMEVVGEAANGADAVRLVAAVRPSVVLMDISMPGLNGLEATRRISQAEVRPRVVMLSMHADEEFVRQALDAGATGYLLKSSDRSELEEALHAAARGEVWLSPAISRASPGLLRGHQHGTPGRIALQLLTSRQREVLQLIAEGHTTKEIAQRMRLSVKTVETHRANLMERLAIRDVPGLVRFAVRVGLVALES